jgi:two-component system LytT family sensor kinase
MVEQLQLSLNQPAFEWSARTKRLVYLAVWSIPGIAALSFYYLNQTVSAQPMSWPFALVSTFPNWYIWAILTPAVIWVGKRFRIERSNWVQTVLLAHIPTMILMLLVHSLVNLFLFYATSMPGHEAMTSGLYKVHFWTRVHSNILTYWTILGAFYAYDYYQKFLNREQAAAILEIRLAEANLRALKMQLHPHFLFNTLNSVAALVRKNDNRIAVKMLVQLGDFLRLALENKGVQEITLEQEVDFLQRYLNIEKIRFQERLTVDYSIDPSLKEVYVPNMILQPVVENAIHHGIGPNAEKGRIEVSARREGDDVILTVQDNGKGLQPKQPGKREGVGVANTRGRLESIYGDRADFRLENAEEGGLIARIRLPYSLTPAISSKTGR